MPFLMIRNDITKVAADAIVNPANRNLLQGSGTSRAIYQAAGEQELTAACEAIGHCEPGRAVCTPAFGLPAKWKESIEPTIMREVMILAKQLGVKAKSK